MANHESEARNWLNYLRGGTDQFDLCLAYFKKEMENAKLTLRDLGTNEEELAELRVKGALTAAKMLLNCLRVKTSHSFLDALDQAMQKGGFSFADIGSSEREFTELAIEAAGDCFF